MFVVDGNSHSKTGIFYVSSQMRHFIKEEGESGEGKTRKNWRRQEEVKGGQAQEINEDVHNLSLVTCVEIRPKKKRSLTVSLLRPLTE